MPANQQGYIVLKVWSICSGVDWPFRPAEGGQFAPAETGYFIRRVHVWELVTLLPFVQNVCRTFWTKADIQQFIKMWRNSLVISKHTLVPSFTQAFKSNSYYQPDMDCNWIKNSEVKNSICYICANLWEIGGELKERLPFEYLQKVVFPFTEVLHDLKT